MTVPIDRVDAKDIDRAKFHAEYESKRRPVVIVGGAKDTKPQAWTLDHLKSVLGDKPIMVNHNPTTIFALDATTKSMRMPFSEAADKIVHGGDGTYYVQNASMRQMFSELLPDVSIPGLIDKDALLAATNMWFGGAGCISPLHYDREDNFLTQVMGTKRVTLFRPEEREHVYPNTQGPQYISRVNVYDPDLETFPLFAEASPRRMVVMIEPGDMLFIPTGWWHAVETLSTSISINFWWSPLHEQEHRLKWRVRWADLATSDVAGAKAFYGGLFGWTFEGEGDGATYLLGEQRVGGLRAKSAGDGLSADPQWIPYLNVASVDDALTNVKTHGGRIVQEPADPDDRGPKAIVADPAGATFGLWQRKPDKSPLREPPGSLRSIDLLASDPSQASFYCEAFGWKGQHAPMSPKGPYTMFSPEPDILVGGMMNMPTAVAGKRTNWIPYFRVADCDADTKKAVGLGAEIVFPPTGIFGGGVRVSILRDPQGALVGLMAY